MTQDASTQVFVNVGQARSMVVREHARVVDARTDRAFEAGHLPGAANWAARDLNPTVAGVRRLVPSDRLAEAMRARRLEGRPLVIYGARGGADAAHLWWTLYAHGHPAAYLLNGGIEAWQRAGLPLESETPPPDAEAEAPQEVFTPRLDASSLAELEELRERLEDPALLLLDTRDLSEYTGAVAAAARGGHAPGARHLDWRALLGEDGLLKPEAALRKLLAPALEAPEVVTYCQSGVRAAHSHAVLTKLGHPNARLYLASWGEWGNRQDTPVRTHDPVEVQP